MSSISTTCRTAVQTTAQTVEPFTGTPDQVVLGDYNWDAGTDFFGNILTSGPWLFIKPTSGDGSGVSFNGMFEFDAHLLYGFEDNMAFDWTDIEDLIFALVSAWVSFARYVDGKVIGPFRLTWKKPEWKQTTAADGTPIFIARTMFTFTLPFVTDQDQGAS